MCILCILSVAGLAITNCKDNENESAMPSLRYKTEMLSAYYMPCIVYKVYTLVLILSMGDCLISNKDVVS